MKDTRSTSTAAAASTAALIDRRMVAFRSATLLAAMNSVGNSLRLQQCTSGAHTVIMQPVSNSVQFQGESESGIRLWELSGPQLAALLIRYCIAARIPLPTRANKTVTVTPDGVVIDFIMTFAKPPNAVLWSEQVPS